MSPRSLAALEVEELHPQPVDEDVQTPAPWEPGAGGSSPARRPWPPERGSGGDGDGGEERPLAEVPDLIVDPEDDLADDFGDDLSGDLPPAFPARLPLARRSEVAPRRHRGSIRRRRPRRWLRLLGLLLKAAGIVALPAAGGFWLFFSSQFAVHHLVAEGTERVSQRWIEQTLQPFVGQNLWMLPLQQVEQRLVQHPWVAAVAISKELPDQLRVRIVEKQPAAVLEGTRASALVDASGNHIVSLEATAVEAAPGAGAARALVHIRGRALQPQDIRRALAVATAWEQVREPWRGDLEAIEVLGEDDFRLLSPQLPFPLLVRQDSLAAKARYLTALLPEIKRRYPELAAVDLRFAQRIVLQPEAVGPIAASPSNPSTVLQPHDGTPAAAGGNRLTIRG